MNSRSAPSVATLNGFEIADIDVAVGRVKPALDALRDASIFMTGGTGFFGQWLLALIARANATQSLGIRATVLTRDAAGFRHRCTELARESFVQLLEGDVRSLDLPTGRFTHLIHAATDTSADADRRPQELTDTILGGTRHVLDYALSSGVGRTLFVSSGAIYGAQPHDVLNLREDFPGAGPTADSRSTYGHAKRLAEQIAAVHGKNSGIPIVIARAFAFVGPALPLDAHFAIGNFIRDAIAGDIVTVKGDGTPLRSYLYAGDLAAWLLQLLVHGRAGEAYNVGSDRAISIAELAALVASILPTARGVTIEGTPAPTNPRSRYIPSIERAQVELALDVWTPLDEAIRRTARWAERQRAQATPVPR